MRKVLVLAVGVLALAGAGCNPTSPYAARVNGGTISHQHGVGLDHAAYLKAEKGETGMRMIESIRQSLDPQRILNPGKLID